MIGDVLKKFFTYGVGNVLQAALNFILLPIFLRFFSPQEYGVISALLVLVSLFTLFAGGGILNGLFRLYFEADGLERKGLVGATWLWYLIAAGLGGMALYTQASAVSMLLFHTKAYAPVVQRAGAVFFFSMLHQVPFSVLRLRKRAGAYIGLSLFNFLLDFAFKMVFIVVLGWGINGYFESGAIAHLLTGCLISLVVYRDVRLACNLTFFKQLFRLGLPYVVSGLSVWALEVSDRLLLTRFAGEAAAGLYSLAGNLAKIFQILLSGPVFLLIDPFFFAYAAEHPLAATRKLLERTLIYFFLAGACLYLAIALGAGDLLRVLVTGFGAQKEYLEAANLVPLLTLVPFLYFLTSQAALGGLLIKRPEITSAICLLAAGINVGLNLVVIPRFGALGAAVDSVIAYSLLWGVLYWRMGKVFPVSYDWKSMAVGACYLALALGLGWQIRLASPVASLFVRVLAGLALFGLLTLFAGGILSPVERQKLFSYLSHARAGLMAGLTRRS